MHAHSRTTGVGLLLVLTLPGCGAGEGTILGLAPQTTTPRIESARTAGDADVLAGELLVAAGATPQTPLRPDLSVGDPGRATALADLAFAHLRSVALGADQGPRAVGSARTQRLALEDDAPVDTNGDGTNRDETLAAEVGRLAAACGAAAPTGLSEPVLPWAEGSADLVAAVTADAALDPSRWRTAAPAARTVRLADIGAAMLGRVRAAESLLRARRGTLFGATPDEGLLGMLLLSQAVGAEEELVRALATTGSTLGGFDDPHAYDPAAGPRWLCAEVEVADADGVLAYAPRDLASDLDGLAAVLDAATELAWFSGPANPSTTAQALFAGPFAPPAPKNPPVPRLNWQNDIRPILFSQCSGCHAGFPTGGFQIDTLAQVRNGSPRTRSFGYTMVIPGDHAQSFLHRMLVGPPAPFLRMPPGFSVMPPAQVARIDTWIDQGALEFPEVLPPPPSPGQDLAAVCFANVVALHFDAATGALDQRREADGGSGTATAAATGHALQALAHLATVQPTLVRGGVAIGDLVRAAATFAAERLLDAEGRALVSIDLATNAPGRPAALADHAALTTGLLTAARVTGVAAHRLAADRAATALVKRFFGADGMLRADPDHAFLRLTPRVLADVLAALREAAAAGTAGATVAFDGLLLRLLPVLAYASWSGTAGLPTPAAAGGAFGRLPVLAGAIRAGADTDVAAADAALTWTQHVRPLLLEKCGNCHFGGSAQGGYRCDTLRLAATAGGENGPTRPIVPGDPEGSFLYRKLVDRVPATGAQMPLQRTMLDDRARALVRQWIAEGASGR